MNEKGTIEALSNEQEATYCKVELSGMVGSVRRTDYGEGRSIIRFSVATQRCFKDREGRATIETTWLNCVAMTGAGGVDFDADRLEKGARVKARGYIRNDRYVNGEGDVSLVTSIVCEEITFV